VRVGVLLPNWVGDVAMATPTLRTLRKNLPHARIIGIARPYLLSLLDGTHWLDATLPWEHKGRGRFARTWHLIQQLRAEQLDLLILLRASLSAGLLARLSGAKKTLGYTRRGFGWLLTDPIARNFSASSPTSAVDDYLELIEHLGFTSESRQLELATTATNEAAADGVWKHLALPPPDRVMLLSTGGAFGDAKHWPTEYCVSLALRAADEFGLTTLVLCGPQERDHAASIESAANHPQVRSLAREDVSFGTTKAIIRRSRLMVTTDSGPRHIGSALGTPTVVLFGPIDPAASRNYQPDTIELTVPLDCRPCAQRTCPLGHHRCMRDLTVDQVLTAVAKMLETTTDKREAA
jgi:lipopolysaccharide heptosyltransferase II